MQAKRISLDIPFDCLLDREYVDRRKTYGSEPIRTDAAYGFTQTGDYITLCDIYTFAPGFFPGGTKQTIKAVEGVCNFHCAQ